MRDYGKVYSTFWSSETTGRMSDDGKILALYLMTCSHATITGVFRLPDGYVAEDLRWEPDRVRQGFAELLAKGFANRCETTKWVWVIKHLEWNKPENPNQRKSAAKMAAGIPRDCSWGPEFMRVCGEVLELEPRADWNPSGTVSQPSRNQEQKQEQKQKQNQEQELVRGSAVGQPPAPMSPAPAPPLAKSLATAPSPAAAASATDRGSRLPKDWVLPKAWGDWALADRTGWTPEVVRLEADKFRDFWVGKTGKDATKLDWLATWRNWCRNAKVHVAARRPTTEAERRVANEANTEEAARLYQQRYGGGARQADQQDVIDGEAHVVAVGQLTLEDDR